MRAERLEDGTFLISCQMDSTPEDVRKTLEAINGLLKGEVSSPAADSNWELVVAEVLNNIVEHAYEDRAGGDILLKLTFAPKRLAVEFTDFGRPMPNGAAPEGAPADLDVAVEDLPEGGFGWFLIRSLSENLAYSHDGDRNRLTLTIPLG
ncbi:ATP-binding protein [Mameliella alba]|nr:ATP-binding protein [Antarctobacter heliothermus]MBY6145050.1 ATP-binding protein [Mameliella alba]MCA0955873.1 ATP-binding protein [Mameliella alba]